MTLLSIAKDMAVEVGEETPASVQDGAPFSRLAVQFINETGRDAIRRVDWHVLAKRYVVTGDGTSRAYDLPNDYDRLIRGQAVSFNGAAVRGSLSSDEWASLSHIEGTPRYFRSASATISFYPFLASGADATVVYQSKSWAVNLAGDGVPSMTKDDDSELISSDLILRGAVWRWLRHAGRDFSDHMAEYEQQIQDYAQAESGMRQP